MSILITINFNFFKVFYLKQLLFIVYYLIKFVIVSIVFIIVLSNIKIKIFNCYKYFK